MIVVDTQGGMAGVVTDGMSEVIRLKASAIVEPSSELLYDRDGAVSGYVLRDKGQGMMIVLDAERLVDCRHYLFE